MSSIFDALPGQETPVGAISKNLARMWATDERAESKAGEDAKATQVNFVLHLGLHTTPQDALAQFQTAVRFSRRYPCRVVVLCPTREENAQDATIRAKIYGECHPGKTRGDLRCCEFVILNYPTAARVFLENQVSICLSTDLPVYYWAHNFSSSAKLGAYQYLLTKAKRVLIDRSLVPPEDTGEVAWPRPEAVRDLAHARLLPVRQTIGQFLSAHPPAALADGIANVLVRHGAARRAEARVLADWSRQRLIGCGAPAALVAKVEVDPAAAPDSVELLFNYANVQSVRFQGDFAKGCAHLSAHIRGSATELATTIGLLSPEAALAEAMFF
jgi:glucose-6-phosphate dehydrogenase assembly protein OpcA